MKALKSAAKEDSTKIVRKSTTKASPLRKKHAPPVVKSGAAPGSPKQPEKPLAGTAAAPLEEKKPAPPSGSPKPVDPAPPSSPTKPKPAKPERPVSKFQQLLHATHRTIASIPYKAAPAAGVSLHPAALTTTDPDGFPSTRTVVPTFIAQDLSEIRISTGNGTRKEAEIQANPKASLHFQDQRGRGGWVTLKGDARVRPADEEGKLEIVLTPLRCEVMSYTENTMADEEGWKPAVMIRSGGDGWRRLH